MKISVIIPTKGRQAIVERTVNMLLAALEGIDAEVIIVNDAVDPINLKNERLQIIRNPSSGAAAARNFGASISSGELLLFLDNDIIITQENILRIKELHQLHPLSAFNFYWIYPPDLMERLPETNFGRYMMSQHQFDNSSRLREEDKNAKGDLIKVSGVASYFLSIEKKDFLKTDGYEERIPQAGVEDIILAKKLKETGIKMFLSKTDIVFHNEADRVSLKTAMVIYQRSAITRKVAVSIGHAEMSIEMSPFKRSLYSLLLPVKFFFIFCAKISPTGKWFDPFYFKMANLLLGISTYRGYYK